MEKTDPSGPWRIWVSPERKIVSFHHHQQFRKLRLDVYKRQE